MCPQRVVGSIRGSCVNTVSPSSFPQRFNWVSTFSLTSLTSQPLLLLIALYCFATTLSIYKATCIFPPLSYYPLIQSIPCPLTPWLPLVLLLFSGLYKTSHLYFHLHFLFSLCNFLLSFASVCLSPCYCSLSPSVCLSLYLYPSTSFSQTSF